ncbi:hypothetical protein CUMW_202330 [Citrus unshiu]|uniref:Uncharacterized protein n=1 Tax=Citrus unshiu TaxID=55188 RepID=A0A2H5Q769_CITUN|nr:hypothetical protein CUMW_202330 [Citrus unshiu]
MAPFSKPSNRMQRKEPQIIGRVSRITCHICQVGSHQPSINAPSITGPNEADHDTTSQIGLQQSLVEDACAADDHYESTHDSDDRNEPESSIHELRSELQTAHSSINELRSELLAEHREAQQYREAVMGFMASFGTGSSNGAYSDSSFGPSHTASDGYGPNVDAGYGTHTDAVRNVRPLPALNITDYEIDERSSVDMNLLRGLEDSRLYEEFDQWFAGNASMGWLGDEHIHTYYRLIREKQRQFPNALLQRVTHTDTYFWACSRTL